MITLFAHLYELMNVITYWSHMAGVARLCTFTKCLVGDLRSDKNAKELTRSYNCYITEPLHSFLLCYFSLGTECILISETRTKSDPGGA
jgi:hypothetical protein